VRQRVFFFDVLRCVAAAAVIAIHVLAPYRHELGAIPFHQWFTAVSVNGLGRWAVPIFIMVTGALMLSDSRAFDAKYYLKRRVAKVLVPFVAWSLVYAGLSGWTAEGFDAGVSRQVLESSYYRPAYYHLGFFYYFIPLYLVIPLLQLLVQRVDKAVLYSVLLVWLLSTGLFLSHIDGPLSNSYWLYGGYLLLGYVLYQLLPLSRTVLIGFVVVGMLALMVTVGAVVDNSLAASEYTVGRWFSYKTLNTALAASMVFMLGRYFAARLGASAARVAGFISRHSLGIYLLHPMFLWPMKAFGWHQGHPAWVIPVWVLLSGSAALAASWLLSRSSKTRWLVP
jgi:surface polysaccharide O-acyltransferase-like enzyme